MDFSETPGARVDIRKPKLQDFIGRGLRVYDAYQKRSRNNAYYWTIDFAARANDGSIHRYLVTWSRDAISLQLGAMAEQGRLKPEYRGFDARLLRVDGDLAFAPLVDIPDPKAKAQPAGPAEEHAAKSAGSATEDIANPSLHEVS